jgi:hypothetical protein
MKHLVLICSTLLLFTACTHKDNTKVVQEKNTTPIIKNGGTLIYFPDVATDAFFKTEVTFTSDVNVDLTAPGKIAATVVNSSEGASQNIVLFENPDLAGNFTLLIEHQINISQIQNINIKQKQIELDRIKDLQEHGAATGKDLLDAQTALSMERTNLANERAALIENETKLKSNGFVPEMLRSAKAGTAYLICDIPENQISKIKKGNACSILFNAFPDEKVMGKIDAVADVVDNETRMIKLRITLNNSDNKLKAGMFATVAFGLNEGKFISISKNSLITVQGVNYVFVKKSEHEFERREIQIGQQVGDRVVVFSGLKNGELIANEGAMQLKGLSFGY